MHTALKPRVVIAGLGFAGLWAARSLARATLDVTLVDKNNYHTFLPLLYQVAAAELAPEQIAYPARGVFRGRRNVRFAMAEIKDIRFDAKVLCTDARDIPYDFLVLGLGSATRFFGVPGAA